MPRESTERLKDRIDELESENEGTARGHLARGFEFKGEHNKA
jgi:hypothetical protein